MDKIISRVECNKLKYLIVNTTSEFESRMTMGTRQIIHLEAYVLNIVKLLHNKVYNK
jgi:hypothetical protein